MLSRGGSLSIRANQFGSSGGAVGAGPGTFGAARELLEPAWGLLAGLGGPAGRDDSISGLPPPFHRNGHHSGTRPNRR